MPYDNTNTAGAWWKTSKNGKQYLSIKANVEGRDYSIALFPNDYKKEDKHPDLKGKVSIPGQFQNNNPASQNTAPPPPPMPDPSQMNADDEVPF